MSGCTIIRFLIEGFATVLVGVTMGCLLGKVVGFLMGIIVGVPEV